MSFPEHQPRRQCKQGRGGGGPFPTTETPFLPTPSVIKRLPPSSPHKKRGSQQPPLLGRSPPPALPAALPGNPQRPPGQAWPPPARVPHLREELGGRHGGWWRSRRRRRRRSHPRGRRRGRLSRLREGGRRLLAARGGKRLPSRAGHVAPWDAPGRGMRRCGRPSAAPSASLRLVRHAGYRRRRPSVRAALPRRWGPDDRDPPSPLFFRRRPGQRRGGRGGQAKPAGPPFWGVRGCRSNPLLPSRRLKSRPPSCERRN